MADMRNRTPFYGAVPTSKLNADHVFMADGSTLQEQADKKFELIDTIALEEDILTVEYTPTTPLSEVIVYINIEAAIGSARLRNRLYENDVLIATDQVANAITTSNRYLMVEYSTNKGVKSYITTNASATLSGTASVYKAPTVFNNNIDKIIFDSLDASVLIPTGSTFKIYGIPA